MKTNKTYTTFEGAYTAAEKVGATRFVVTKLDTRIDNIITHTYKRKSDRTFAKWNLVRYKDTICVLDRVEKGFKWTALGKFTDKKDFVTDEKSDKKPRTHKPAPAKGKVVLGKADKKAIRSECYKLAKGDRAMYDKLCQERGVDNHR